MLQSTGQIAVAEALEDLSVLAPANIDLRVGILQPHRDVQISRDEVLAHLHHSPDPKTLRSDEAALLQSWSRFLPLDRWGAVLLSWMRALECYGTQDFANSSKLVRDTFILGGIEYESFGIQNNNHAKRREHMKLQPPYDPIIRLEEHGRRFDHNCPLCANSTQGLDALYGTAPDNVVLRIGSSILIPNRYPALPGHMLWMKEGHDDVSHRVPPIHREEPGQIGTTKCYPVSADRLRGNIMLPEDLGRLFWLCDTLDLQAYRNHPMDAMSIPFHDHWHVYPEGIFPAENIQSIFDSVAVTPTPSATRLQSTPFECIAVACEDREKLAFEVSRVTEAFEQRNEVFCAAYRRGVLLISPRRPNGERVQQIGSGIPIHCFNTDQLFLEQIARSVPLRGETVVPELGIVRENPLDPESSAAKPRSVADLVRSYIPIDWSCQKNWGMGENLQSLLSPFQQQLWQKLLPLQDHREDTGHGEIVTYFALKLADLAGLSGDDREIVGLAAMFHDTGYSRIPDINARFRAAITKKEQGKTKEEREQGIQEERNIRILHQDFAVDIAREVLGEDHPLLSQVTLAIFDHDTRVHAPSRLAKIMWDADVLWRVTVQGDRCYPTFAPRSFGAILERFERCKSLMKTKLGTGVLAVEAISAAVFIHHNLYQLEGHPEILRRIAPPDNNVISCLPELMSEAS